MSDVTPVYWMLLPVTRNSAAIVHLTLPKVGLNRDVPSLTWTTFCTVPLPCVRASPIMMPRW